MSTVWGLIFFGVGGSLFSGVFRLVMCVMSFVGFAVIEKKARSSKKLLF